MSETETGDPLCRWCRKALPTGASICTECGQWQRRRDHWLRSAPTIGLGLLSVGLGAYIYLDERASKADLVKIDTEIEAVEHMYRVCFGEAARECPWDYRHALIVRFFDTQDLVREVLSGAARREARDRLEAVNVVDALERELTAAQGDLRALDLRDKPDTEDTPEPNKP